MWNMTMSHKSKMMDRGVPLNGPQLLCLELLAIRTKSFIISDMNVVMRMYQKIPYSVWNKVTL